MIAMSFSGSIIRIPSGRIDTGVDIPLCELIEHFLHQALSSRTEQVWVHGIYGLMVHSN